jgi:hypothetical protein
MVREPGGGGDVREAEDDIIPVRARAERVIPPIVQKFDMDQGGGGTWKVNSSRDGPKVLVSEVERGYLEEVWESYVTPR